MPQPSAGRYSADRYSADRYFAEIRASAATLAEIASNYDADLPVPTCPDWTLRQLATHVGRVHRWAAEIVRTRSQERIPFSSAPDGSYPAEPSDRAAWLVAGADRVIAAVDAAGPAPVWAFSEIAPASFWARRQAQETMMHRVDGELAVGRDVMLDAGLAADGIDEWLTSATDPRYRQRGDGRQALPAGTAMKLQATGMSSGDAVREWLIRSTDGGLSLHRGPGAPDIDDADLDDADTGEADVSVSGPADRLLLVLVRRLPADEPSIAVSGDAALLTGWLAGTPF
jgi:uncharacterized protein (TIGR03083 family)